MTVTDPRTLPWRVHHVIAELDAHGEIDRHAAMCLRQAIDTAPPGATELCRIDLRDLAAIDEVTLQLLATLTADCHARGMSLGLLLDSHARENGIAEAFVLTGLGDTLHYAATDAPTRSPSGRGRSMARWRSWRRQGLARP